MILCATIAMSRYRTLYGLLGVHDFNLWMPNGIGAVLGLVQVGLRKNGSCKPCLWATHCLLAVFLPFLVVVLALEYLHTRLTMLTKSSIVFTHACPCQ
jgi:hypothetical protein